MTERYGSRIAPGGYQAPSTNAAALERGKPTHRGRWQRGPLTIELAMVPLTGGRPELFELEYKWNDPGPPGASMYCPCLIRGAHFAREAFGRTAAAIDRGELPDQVITAPGTPLGP